MLKEVGAYLTQKLYIEHVIEEDDIEWYSYGFEITLSNIINFLLMLLAGVLWKDIISMLIYYAAFVSVRIFSGGYHAKTYGRCMTLFFLSNLLCGGIKEFIINHMSAGFIKGILAIAVLTSGMCIFHFAPVEHENRPMTAEEKEKFYQRALALWGIWSVLGCIFIWNNIQPYCVMISLALFMVSILMAFAKLENRRRLK